MSQITFTNQGWLDRDAELSLREQALADLALKIGANGALHKHDPIEHLRNDGLNEEEVTQTVKFAALFKYWQRSQATQDVTVEKTTDAQLQPPLFDSLPYFFEGANPFEIVSP